MKRETSSKETILRYSEDAANADLIAALTEYLQQGKPIDDNIKQLYEELDVFATANRLLTTKEPVLGKMRNDKPNEIVDEGERPDITLLPLQFQSVLLYHKFGHLLTNSLV